MSSWRLRINPVDRGVVAAGGASNGARQWPTQAGANLLQAKLVTDKQVDCTRRLGDASSEAHSKRYR